MTPTAPAYTVRMDEQEHAYFINDGSGERPAPGTTTVIEAMGAPWLADWKLGEMARALGIAKHPDSKIAWKKPQFVAGGVWEPGKSYTAPEIVSAVNTARLASYKKSKKAMNTGTDAHAWIEEWIKQRAQHTEVTMHLPVDDEARNAVKSFIKWTCQHEIEFLDSERIVASVTDWYAGTFDVRARVDGIPFIVDNKTSGAVRDSYWIQLSAYLNAYAEQTGDKEPYGRAVLRIPKDGGDAEWHLAPAWATHERCLAAFRACLVLHRFQQAAAAGRG